MLGVGVALHFADIGVRCYHGTTPISSTPEAMSFVAFLVAAGYLLTSLRYELTAAGAFAVPAVVALILLARLAPAEASRPGDGTRSGRLTSCWRRWGSRCSRSRRCWRSSTCFRTAASSASSSTARSTRGTPLETLDRLAHRCVSIGFPVFTLAIVTGAIWVARLGLLHGPGALRPEYLIAVGTWIAFAVLLIARVGAGWRGRRAAWLTLGGFGGTALVVAAYFMRHAA